MKKKILHLLLSVVWLCSILLLANCQPVQGGVLNLYGIDPLTLDPAVSGEATSHEYIMQIFSGLIRLNTNLEPVPDIAQNWQISNNGKTYTFYIRHGTMFHDGREVKAEDFKYAWERACAPDTRSQTASTYLGDIIGVSEVLTGASQKISGVKVINDFTLEVTIDAPKSYFLSKLTYPTAFVVDRANVASGKEWWHSPNGTGPFKLKQWEENSSFVLEKNDLFYGEAVEVKQVVFKLWGGVPIDMYETGEIDVTNINLNYIDKIRDETGPFYHDLTILPELSLAYIGFNTTKPPFDDANIRLAFSQAIDKDKIVSLVFRDMVQRADGILPPGIPGFNKDLTGLNYNVDKAKELIANSKYGDVSLLPPITITTSGWGGLISQGLEAIIYEWRLNLGVDVKVRQLEPRRFLYELTEEKDEMFYTGWIADYPHPQNFLDVLFHSRSKNNAGEYSQHEVDILLKQAGIEQENILSLELYQQAEQKLIEDAACLPLWFGENYILVKPYVQGYRVNPMGFAILGEVSVEPHLT
ncbi:peptide ABC transporter substrate-binding protein [Chloroflexota bacterium]